MDSEVKIKAKFKGTSRRFSIPYSITWQELSAKLTNFFDLDTNFRLKYCDDENELVLISSQEELDEALKLYKKKPGLLSLYVEDPSAPQFTDATLLNLHNRNQNENQGNEKGMHTGYAAAASAIAPEFSEMNARLQAKSDEEANKISKPASIHDEHESPRSEASEVSIPEHTGYVNLEEIMAQNKSGSQAGSDGNQKRLVPSFEVEPSSANTNANGSSRGWFLEDKCQQQPPSSRGNGKTKKTKKKKPRNGYSEFASILAPQLAAVNVKEPQKKSSDAVASEDDDTGISEPTSITGQASSSSVLNSSPEISGGSLNSPADFNQQQMIQNGQKREFKRSRRPKKHGKKKGCYAQAALDIAPLYQAMNDRLKEQQLMQQNSQENDSRNNDSEGEEQSPEDSPSSESSFEPFVFVNAQDGQPSLVPTSMETDQTEVDAVEDGGPTGHSSQQPEKQVDSECSVDDNKKEENAATEEQRDINVVVKEVLHGSMDFIVEQAVQRVQQLSLNPSRQDPSDEASSSTDVDEKVLHKGITCDNCEIEIQGVRFKCCNCLDFDLCEPCESKDGIHEVDHVFVKLRYPAPGIGRKHGQMVPIFKNSVYKKSHHDDKKLKKTEAKAQRKAAKESEKEERRAALKELKYALKSQEKERKRYEKHLKRQRQEKKFEQQPSVDPRAQRMAKVYEKLKMEYIRDVSFPDGSVVSPGQKFLKTWLIQNAGTIAWNQWIKLECIEGGIMVTPGKSQAHVPHLNPGMQGEVSVEFVAPELPGTYSSKWHLTYGLHTFGPQLWCEIKVATPSNTDKEKPVQYDQTTLVNSAFVNDTPNVPNVALVEDTKLQAASYLIVEDGSGSEYHSSEETPETKQGCREVPLSSMEAQQRQDLEWDAGCVHDIEVLNVSPENEESFNLISFSGTEDMDRSNNSEDSDDEEDSDSSLDEFTVLIPPCFDPETPLSADPVPVKVECPKRSGSFNPKLLPKSFEPYLNLDDNNEPSSLATMSSSVPAASFENFARSNEATKVQSVPVLSPDSDAKTDQGEETPSGRISPVEHSVQRSTQTETPVSRQPHITPGENVPRASNPPAIADRALSHDGRTSYSGSPVPTNVVSDVLSSAIDVVANAGRAAMATVDNLINGAGVQASATYKPEDDCEVTVDRRSNNSFDAPPPPTVNNPMGHLIEMGFADRRLNEQLLRKHNNDIRATIDELLSHTENEWSSQRH